jgi:hypothetical protein
MLYAFAGMIGAATQNCARGASEGLGMSAIRANRPAEGSFLRSEADRVQREMIGYAHLSDAAVKSTTIIADSV